jgi:hypothetical protein
MTLQSFVNTCKRDGFARVKGVFSLVEVNKMRAEAILAMRIAKDVEVLNGYPTLLYNPPSAYLQDVSRDGRLLEIVGAYFGSDNYTLETQQYYFHLPGDPDEFAWHTDERFRPGVGNLYLQTAIVIDDWTEENSAVEFIKGSHLKPFENSPKLREFVRNGMKGTKLYAKAGDVLTWSNTVVHGSERNNGTTPRQYYMNGYRGKDLAKC